MADVSGINREELLVLSKMFLKYHDDIKDLFLEYKKTVGDTSKYYQGETAEAFRNKFNDFNLNLELVLKSFLDYSEALTKIVKNYDELTLNSSMGKYQ